MSQFYVLIVNLNFEFLLIHLILNLIVVDIFYMMYLNAQSNHQQWENIIKIKNDKINQLEKQIQQYGQYTNTHSNSHSPIKQPEPIKIVESTQCHECMNDLIKAYIALFEDGDFHKAKVKLLESISWSKWS
eukprot:139728_1